MRILTVCLGNICRSPTGEAALRAVFDERGLDVEVDSAGTAAYHVGEPPDHRMTAAAADVDLRLRGAARQVTPEDLERFDLVLAMDQSNLSDLRRIAPPGLPDGRMRLFRDFDPDGRGRDVPDPYYGGRDGFDEVVEMCRRTAEAIADEVEAGRL